MKETFSLTGGQSIGVDLVASECAFLLSDDEVDENLAETVPDRAVAFPFKALGNSDHAGNNPAPGTSVAAVIWRIAAVVEEEPEDGGDARVGGGIHFSDFHA